MPTPERHRQPPGKPRDRRIPRDRREVSTLRVTRVLSATPGEDGMVELRGIVDNDQPLVIVLPIQAAMTMLNELQGLSTAARWFAVD